MARQAGSLETRDLIAFSVVLIVVVGGFIVWDAYRSNEVRGWVEVDAQIDPASARLDEVRVRSEGVVRRFQVPLIDYEYTFDGVAYTNDDVFVPERRFRDQDEAQGVLDEIVASDALTALVDPDSPGDATLRRDSAGITWRLIGLVALAVGLPLVFWSSDRRQRRRTAVRMSIDPG